MNKPTPIGKKTFAEYEKELKSFKEFNLKAQKINLSVVSDIKEANTAVSKTISEVTKFKNVAENYLDNQLDMLKKVRKNLFDVRGEAESFFQKLDKAFEDSGDALQEAGTAAKELGFKSEDVKGYKELDQQRDDISDYEKDLENLVKQYDALIKVVS